MTVWRSRRRRLAVAAALVLSVGIGVGVYALTASNTVPGTAAGAGAGAISGYTITNVQYGLNTSTPTNIDTVSFTISPTSATTVKVQLASAGSWYSCTNTSGSVSCGTTSPQATVAPATQLTVVATE
jgi:hypothetical protein